MWCKDSISSVKSDFLGSTTTKCDNMLWRGTTVQGMSWGMSDAHCPNKSKRFQNDFNTNSTFPFLRVKAVISWNLNYSHDKIVVSLVFRFHNSSAETIRILMKEATAVEKGVTVLDRIDNHSIMHSTG